ncbi:MerR family transcriptional regulator [Luteipulveratus halotolerans]|uniref:HTH merR-type domain-containing protein n=1 Tax=Luteipulveratus halotolerans TaxID=1631356 RepID=A0A0L6CJE8_9MICO|nr:MerR family transcriptional regulator [Luteipulveratus halotolerans]KNX37633.1 hypothetical protein VV01_11520 [Luteipulveratus halotolerans]
MRISDLAARTDVPIATLKFYLREGVLHPGEVLSRTQAAYDDSHVDRVRLIRALMDVGGLSMTSTRAVLTALDHPPAARHDLLGVAQAALGDDRPPADPALAEEAWAWVHERGWHIQPGESLVSRLSDQVAAARAAGIDVTWERLGQYADAVEQVADVDVASVPADDEAAALTYVVVGTVMVDPVLQTLRRLAQQDRSARIWAD